MIHREPNARIFKDSIPGSDYLSAFDLIRNVNGVRVVGTYPYQSVIIRGGSSSLLGSNSPLFLLDGMEIGAPAAAMMANEIMFIDVLMGANAGMYGVRAANSVVAMYSFVDLDIDEPVQTRRLGITNFRIHGFAKKREFYSPNYNKPEPKHLQRDYRTSLHWEPNFSFEEGHNSDLSFFTGDEPGVYAIQIEGLTLDGRIVNAIKNFVIE